MKLLNSGGKIWYGMHFYPGVAEYREPGKDPYRVFLNEDTLRAMDPTFAGKPIFIEHVDEVEQNLDELRKEAEGWVIESFYNSADGKHWVKFITVTDRAERAIKSGMRLSNAYYPTADGKGGMWNGVDYAKQIKNGEYEHLAIVKNPRYEESVIMTPEEFKAYNESKRVELLRIANSKEEQGETKMKLNFFKRAKVENTVDLEGMMVELPKSKKEVSITDLVTQMDKVMNMNGYADGEHRVKVGENEMSVNELVEKHLQCMNELAELKGKQEQSEESEMEPKDKKVEDAAEEKEVKEPKEEKENMDDKEAKEAAEDLVEHEEEEIEAAKKNSVAAEKKAEAKKKADALRNAHIAATVEQTVVIETLTDQVARGRSLYGA
jgi:hypothetical protein